MSVCVYFKLKLQQKKKQFRIFDNLNNIYLKIYIKFTYLALKKII